MTKEEEAAKNFGEEPERKREEKVGEKRKSRLCLGFDRIGLSQNPKKNFSKLIPIFLLFLSHQSLFITIQIKKSLQNKKFHFFIQNILTFFFT
jgi:hypothetical protein